MTELCGVCGSTRSDGGKWQAKRASFAVVTTCDDCRDASPEDRDARSEHAVYRIELDLRDRSERSRHLPNGMTCADCARFPKCEEHFGARPTSLVCDWSVTSAFKLK